MLQAILFNLRNTQAFVQLIQQSMGFHSSPDTFEGGSGCSSSIERENAYTSGGVNGGRLEEA